MSEHHLSTAQLDKYEIFMQPATKSLAIRGPMDNFKLSELHLNFLKTVASKCSQLEDLIIEDYYINRDKVSFVNQKNTSKILLKYTIFCHCRFTFNIFLKH